LLAATIHAKDCCHCRCFATALLLAMDLAKQAILNHHKDLEGYYNLFNPEGMLMEYMTEDLKKMF